MLVFLRGIRFRRRGQRHTTYFYVRGRIERPSGKVKTLQYADNHDIAR